MSISLRAARMSSLKDKLSQQAEPPKKVRARRAIRKLVETIIPKKKKIKK